jgi:hypothetical protein
MSNCLIFALRKWFKSGGYLVIRASKRGPWLHFLWCRDLRDAEIEHYVPSRGRLKVGSISKFLFRGKVKVRDNYHVTENVQ